MVFTTEITEDTEENRTGNHDSDRMNRIQNEERMNRIINEKRVFLDLLYLVYPYQSRSSCPSGGSDFSLPFFSVCSVYSVVES